MRIRNAFSGLRSRLIHCKSIARTEHLLEAPFRIRPGMRMGIAPMGYADGLETLNCGVALVRGRRVPVLGGSSLEHTRLDLTEVPDARVGDEVVFIGRQGAAEITPQEVLTHLNLGQPARMATAVRESVARRYLRTAT
jgi:alanine racemase